MHSNNALHKHYKHQKHHKIVLDRWTLFEFHPLKRFITLH